VALDHVDPSSLATDLMRTAFAVAWLPPELACVLATHTLCCGCLPTVVGRTPAGWPVSTHLDEPEAAFRVVLTWVVDLGRCPDSLERLDPNPNVNV
jgi:hypothetical protein